MRTFREMESVVEQYNRDLAEGERQVSRKPVSYTHLDVYKRQVQILAPESLKEQYRQMLTKATEDMKENE